MMRSASHVMLVVLIAATSACTAGRSQVNEVRSPFLTPFERDVLREINLARSDPQAYAEYVAEWLPYFDMKRRTLPDQETVWTTEGAEAVSHAAYFLNRVEPVDELIALEGLSKAARDHVDDMAPAGAVGHMGMDGSESHTRIERYGDWTGKIGEVICYGAFTARDIVIQWIVDDGVPTRAHRTTLFDGDFRFAGIAYGEHAQFGTICVVTFAKAYIEDG